MVADALEQEAEDVEEGVCRTPLASPDDAAAAAAASASASASALVKLRDEDGVMTAASCDADAVLEEVSSEYRLNSVPSIDREEDSRMPGPGPFLIVLLLLLLLPVPPVLPLPAPPIDADISSSLKLN